VAFNVGEIAPGGGRFYVLLGGFCDLPDLGAISVSKGAICAG